CARREWYFDYW
nr:immunoglobulin heavy chain junction region [Mus musculus]